MNILIVEDQEDWQDLYREIFGGPDTHLTVVDNVPEAVRLIQRGDKTFDLALVDKGGSGRWSGEPDIIGHRDGLRVLGLLKDEQPACIRTLATAEPYEQGAFNRLGLDIFFDKRFGSLGDLFATVDSWYKREYFKTARPILIDGRSGGSREKLS